MTNLDTIARRHAERVLAVVETAQTPLLEPTLGPVHRRMPRPVWAGVGVAVLVVLVFVVPWLLAGVDGDRDVAITVPTETVPVGPEGGFFTTGSMSTGCAWCQAVVLADGRVLVVPSGEIYDPETWSFGPTEPFSRWGLFATAVLLDDGQVLVTGLPMQEGEALYVEIYDPVTGTSRRQEHQFDVGAAAVRLDDGRVLIVGSRLTGDAPGPAAIYDPIEGTFSATGAMNVQRQEDVRLVPLEDGRVLVVGGSSDRRSAEIYDPGTGVFSATGSMIFARSDLTATRLLDGRVLVVGGSSDPTAETFDPTTGTFALTGSMEVPRVWHDAALLPDGRVLVVGGFPHGDGIRVDEGAFTEIYDPETGRFTRGPVTIQPRVAATAVSIPSGVLVLGHYAGNGGGVGNQAASSAAEVFTLGPVERPVGCCPESPGLISVSATAERPGMWPTSLVVPPGALEGVVGAFVRVDVSWSEGGQGEGGEMSLSQCSEGCPISLPSFPSVPAEAIMTVQVDITYRGTPPVQASGIDIEIDEGGG